MRYQSFAFHWLLLWRKFQLKLLCFNLHSMVFFNNYYGYKNLSLFHIKKTTANVLLVNLQKLSLVLTHGNLRDLLINVIIYELFWLIAKITEQSIAHFTHSSFSRHHQRHTDLWSSLRRLGSLLSDHLVNDRHLRKGNREHKELLNACKVSVASLWCRSHISGLFVVCFAAILIQVSVALGFVKRHFNFSKYIWSRNVFIRRWLGGNSGIIRILQAVVEAYNFLIPTGFGL